MKSLYFPPEIRYGNTFSKYANSFRSIGMLIDRNPEKMTTYYNLPAITFLLSDRDSTTLDRTRYLEALSYGDPGVLLASPGPSLSGLMMRELGLPEQIETFYTTLFHQKMKTFFALTEPEKGSDANHLEARLTAVSSKKDMYFLNGKKCFFGNGVTGETGITLARTAQGPAGIRVVWLTPDILNQNTIEKKLLPMWSLRGAQIALMAFQNTAIPSECILGQHKSACENGLLSVVKVFNKLRTGVGALALGLAQAVLDICSYEYSKQMLLKNSEWQLLQEKLNNVRILLHNAAKKVDENALESRAPSLAKALATQTAEKVVSHCVHNCSYDFLIQNEWLLKAYRDVFCFEFMEGTTHIHKKIIMRGL